MVSVMVDVCADVSKQRFFMLANLLPCAFIPSRASFLPTRWLASFHSDEFPGKTRLTQNSLFPHGSFTLPSLPLLLPPPPFALSGLEEWLGWVRMPRLWMLAICDRRAVRQLLGATEPATKRDGSERSLDCYRSNLAQNGKKLKAFIMVPARPD